MESNSSKKFKTKEEAHFYYFVEKVIDSVEIAEKNNISHSKACDLISEKLKIVMDFYKNDTEGLDRYMDGSKIKFLEKRVDGSKVMGFSRAGFLSLMPYDLGDPFVDLTVECGNAQDDILDALGLNFMDLFKEYTKEKGLDK